MELLGQPFVEYIDLVNVMRQRRAELRLSNERFDELAGFTVDQANKLLGYRLLKRFGPPTLGPALGVLGLRLQFVDDPEAAARTVERRTPRSDQHIQPRNIIHRLDRLRAGAR